MSAPDPGQDVDDAGREDLGEDVWANASAVSGVRADGLRTTVLPVASAGPSFQLAMYSG